jgi:hypothetical protein
MTRAEPDLATTTTLLAIPRFSATSTEPATALLAMARFFSSVFTSDNTAIGRLALGSNDFFATGFPSGLFNDAVGADGLVSNTDGFSNNAFGNSALFFNVIAVANTAIGDVALANNDSDGAGFANNNTAVGAGALLNNIDGSENTAVGTGSGPNLVAGFNNTYVGDFVGSLAPDESNTIRIGDLSNGNGAGSLACFIGGIFNNFQPVGGDVVEVTIDLANDELGWDFGRTRVVAHLLCLVAHLYIVARRARLPSAPPCPKLAKLRSWKQRSRSNRNK